MRVCFVIDVITEIARDGILLRSKPLGSLRYLPGVRVGESPLDAEPSMVGQRNSDVVSDRLRLSLRLKLSVGQFEPISGLSWPHFLHII